jgi:hypothetical protein
MQAKNEIGIKKLKEYKVTSAACNLPENKVDYPART